MSSWKWKDWNSILMYNPNSGNVRSLGRVFFFRKWKLKWFQITWANILFTIEHREHNKCLNWDILQFYAQNELIWNLMPTTGLKIIGTGASLPRCSISSSFQNSLKTSGHLGCDFFGVLVLEFGAILAWYRFPAAGEFVIAFDVFFV